MPSSIVSRTLCLSPTRLLARVHRDPWTWKRRNADGMWHEYPVIAGVDGNGMVVGTRRELCHYRVRSGVHDAEDRIVRCCRRGTADAGAGVHPEPQRHEVPI